MIKLIIEKELREIIGSTKFAISYGVCALLILLTFYIGARNYQVSTAQYDAAKKENIRQMEGLADWMAVRNHRIFLPPQPLATLVSGISNDIGRTIEVRGRGELTAQDSRYNDEPIYAAFRFLDLDFIFQIVLSLFAILFTYDAINGEKERGTLRLTFANAVPRFKFILGKILGSFLALGIPLLVPVLLGCLLLIILGVPLSGSGWLRLALVIAAGLLYFGVFLTLSVFASSLTKRSASSFLMLLVIWIFAVLIIPRSAVLLSGRAVDVPSVDEIASQKNRFQAQVWQEDREKMNTFRPTVTDDGQKMVEEFNQFMQERADEREKKILEFAGRLNEERQNRQRQQELLAFSLARISPAAAFSLAAANLAGTSIGLQQHFIDEATAYQRVYAQFMKEKTGMNLGGHVMMFRMRAGEEEEPEPIDPSELPGFDYREVQLGKTAGAMMIDFGILALFNVVFFAGAFVAFLRYDLR
jgi:ABC-type transport system involved in multi-copper enzyme maturation permease subunit